MHNREIGSEFNIDMSVLSIRDESPNNIFKYLSNYNIQLFDSGRSALLSLLENLKARKVLLPNYICESVRKCFQNSQVDYYDVNDEFKIDWDDLKRKSDDKDLDILYLHFFNGYIDSDYNFKELYNIKKKRNFIIIEDTTHSIFTINRTIGDYCVCSLRKWYPIPDGGVLYSNRYLEHKKYLFNTWADSKKNAMIQKTKYLNGAKISKKSFVHIFHECENYLDDQDKPFNISKASYDILKVIDINEIIKFRVNNFSGLYKYLAKTNMKICAANGTKQVPLFFITKIPYRDKLKEYLIDNCIYCPTHWPLYEEIKKYENAIKNNSQELSIPIDQRYTKEDMEYIANKIINFLVNNKVQ